MEVLLQVDKSTSSNKLAEKKGKKMDIFKTRRNAPKRYKIKTGLTGLIFIVLILVFSQNALAGENITVKDCDTCTYNATAYNYGSKQYYILSGILTENPASIRIPDGYACLINLIKGRRVGTRNLYEKRDPVNPTYRIVNESSYVLGIIYMGHRAFSSGPQIGRKPPP